MSLAPCYAINTQTVASEIFDSEAIVMNLSNAMYYTLNGTGAEIWTMIEQRQPRSRILDHLVGRYGVPLEQAREDLDALFVHLDEFGLIEPAEPVNADTSVLTVYFGAYSKPELVHHDDMADVLAMDPPLPEPTKIERA